MKSWLFFLPVALLLLAWRRGPAAWDVALVNLSAGIGSGTDPGAALTDSGRCRMAHVQGRDQLLAGEAAAALPVLEQGAGCDNGRWPHLDLGRAQLAVGEVEAAAASWQVADAYRYPARLAGQAEEPAAALAYWQIAALVEPDNAQPYVKMGELAADPDQAEQLFRQALVVDENDAPAYAALANLILRGDGGAVSAQPLFEQAHALDPDHVGILIALANNTARLDKLAAVIYWQRLADSAPERAALADYNIGKLYVESGLAPAALPYHLRAVQARPDNAGYLTALAENYAALGCAQQAVDVYRDVLVVRPDGELAVKAAAQLEQLASATNAGCALLD